jgi:hypothetical protein
MDCSSAPKFDKLSDFAAELKRIEGTYIKFVSAELAQARNSVVGSLPGFKCSRMDFGRVLRAYKEHFKAERGWMEAAKVIAGALRCDERTVYRIIEDYERASQLPAVTLEAMAEQKIDPAAAKNAEIVGNLLQMPVPATREEATTIVAACHGEQVERKRQARKQSTATTSKVDLDGFARHIAKQFEDRFRSAAPETRDAEVQFVIEFVVSTIHAGISEVRHFDRPNLVPKPMMNVAA